MLSCLCLCLSYVLLVAAFAYCYLPSPPSPSGELITAELFTPPGTPRSGAGAAAAAALAGDIIDRAGARAGEKEEAGAGADPSPPRNIRSKSISVHSIYRSSYTGGGGGGGGGGKGKSAVRLQGYLWKQSNNIARDWQRRWFIIESGHLWYMQTDVGSGKPLIGAGAAAGLLGQGATSRDPGMHGRLLQAVERKVVCSLLISTVKELAGPSELKYCWQVISPGKRVYVLQAESAASRDAWVAALRSEIEISLSMVQTDGGRSSYCSSGVGSPYGGPRDCDANSSADVQQGQGQGYEATIVLSEGQQAALRTVNRLCADCQTPDPEWASVNNGVMLCIECCGAHRSLGTHVSKVRSLRLDRWTPNSAKLLTVVGNRRFNNIFERALLDGGGAAGAAGAGLARPTAGSSRAERVAFVTAKYLERRFVVSSQSPEEADAGLIGAAGEGDIVGMVAAIAAGADVNARSRDAHLLSALHCACRGGHDLAVELLCQMNASVDVLDALGKTPSDYIDNDNIAVIDTFYTNVENVLNSYESNEPV
jgi:hypothetical protein